MKHFTHYSWCLIFLVISFIFSDSFKKTEKLDLLSQGFFKRGSDYYQLDLAKDNGSCWNLIQWISSSNLCRPMKKWDCLRKVYRESENIPAFVHKEPRFLTRDPNSGHGNRSFPRLPHLSRLLQKPPWVAFEYCGIGSAMSWSCYQPSLTWLVEDCKAESNIHLPGASISPSWTEPSAV